MAKRKWFHAIGASGKTTANVAKLYKEMGWFVTGSDIQFLPPASLILDEHKIPYDKGYTFKHLTKDFWEEKLNTKLDIPDSPNLGLIVESATVKNKELLYAKRHNIDVRPYAEILGESLVQEESIVVVGSAGKTTTTSAITKLLVDLGIDPNYMIGADVLDFDSSLVKAESRFSVMEGDEFYNPDISNGPKFMSYKPKYLLITNIGYEHEDVYKTREEYIEAFQKVCESVPKEGFILLHESVDVIDESILKARVIRYGANSSNDFYFGKNSSENGTTVTLKHGSSEIVTFDTSLIGEYTLHNLVGALSLVLSIPATVMNSDVLWKGTDNFGIISKSISSFRGPQKRLEILHRSSSRVIVDDFGVTPSRAKNSLKTLKDSFPDMNIVAIFEPNSASRTVSKEYLEKSYAGVFKHAERVIIPELSTYNAELTTSDELVEILSNEGIKAATCKPELIVQEMISLDKETNYLIVFFSSYRLTELAYELASKLK